MDTDPPVEQSKPQLFRIVVPIHALAQRDPETAAILCGLISSLKRNEHAWDPPGCTYNHDWAVLTDLPPQELQPALHPFLQPISSDSSSPLDARATA